MLYRDKSGMLLLTYALIGRTHPVRFSTVQLPRVVRQQLINASTNASMIRSGATNPTGLRLSNKVVYLLLRYP